MNSAEETVVNNPEETLKEVPPNKEKLVEKTSGKYGKDGHPKRSKKEERQHKKEDKATEQFLKSLDSVSSTEDKLAALTKKFGEVSDENRRLQAFIAQSNKRMAGVFKEKETLQLEYNRTVLVKSKLENLCRELQKQNKTIKEESLLRIREEEEKRKETQGKFQTALTEITSLLQQNNDKNTKLSEDNITMSSKLKGVIEKYELREQQVEKLTKQMELENQLSEAKLAKCRLEAQAERERLNAEIAHHKLQLGQYQARILESKNLEESLRSQLNVYTDKYDEFQNALVKSNQVFGGFKGEIEKMSKKITKLEKECASWKKRWETSQVALLEMATDKRTRDDQAATTERQLAQMQRLCRSMQAERTQLLKTLEEHNIERPPLPVLPPAPAPAPQPAQPSKVDAMAANCAQMKQSLAQLQNQLNVLTTKKEEENQTKIEQQASKSKKSKGKKNKDKVHQENIVDKENIKQTETQETNKETSHEDTTNEKITDLDSKDGKELTSDNLSNKTNDSSTPVNVNEADKDKGLENFAKHATDNNEIKKETDSAQITKSADLTSGDTKIETNQSTMDGDKDIQTDIVDNLEAVKSELEFSTNDLQNVKTEEVQPVS